MSLNSFNSGSLVEVVPESVEVPGNFPDKMSTFTQSTTPVNSGSDLFQALSGPEPAASSTNLFQAPFGSQPGASASSVDLFQSPATFSSPSIDLFQSSTVSAPSPIQHQIPKTATATSLDLFADFPQHSHVITEKTLPEPSIPRDEGWATFDSPQPTAPTPAAESLTYAEVPSNDAFSSFDSSTNQPASQKPGPRDAPSGAAYARDASLIHAQAPPVISSAQVGHLICNLMPY